MKNKSTRAPSAKAIHPNASATADSFQNFRARIGYGTGNLSDGGGYAVDFLSRNRYQLEAMYRSSWIVGKAVDLVAEDMTKRGIDINSQVDPGEIDELTRIWKDMKLWDGLCDAVKWARLYGGAIAVLLIDGQNFATPLRPETVLAKGQLKGLKVFDRWQLQPSLTELIPDLGPNLGLPVYYDLTAGAPGMPGKRIHYSRVIRVIGQDLPYWQQLSEMMWGQSVVERMFDRLLAFDSTTQGAAQLVYKAHLRTYKVEGLRDIIAMGGPALEGLLKQINFIRATQTNEGMTLLDSTDEFEAHSYAFGGLDTVLLQFGQQLSGALDIPLTKLFGQSPAGLNATGESDERNYEGGINQQQERRLRTGVGLLLQLSYQSAFGKAMPPGSDFAFRPLSGLSDEQKAGVASTLTGAVQGGFTTGLVGRQTALKELRGQSRLTGTWTNISDEDIEAADNDVTPPGELGVEPPPPDGAAVEEEDEDQKRAVA